MELRGFEDPVRLYEVRWQGWREPRIQYAQTADGASIAFRPLGEDAG